MCLIGNDRNFIGSVHSVLLLRIYYTFWEGQKKGNDQVMIEYNVAIQAIAEKKLGISNGISNLKKIIYRAKEWSEIGESPLWSATSVFIFHS